MGLNGRGGGTPLKNTDDFEEKKMKRHKNKTKEAWGWSRQASNMRADEEEKSSEDEDATVMKHWCVCVGGGANGLTAITCFLF